MLIRSLPVGPIHANCYLLKLDHQSQGVILDPGGDSAQIISQCQELAMTPVAILLTHGHFDHVGAIDNLRSRWPDLPIYCHSEDVGVYPQLKLRPIPNIILLEGGEDLELAGLTIHVYHTPGHSRGSVTFRCGDCLFTGDTLFRGSMGRTDFPGGDMTQMTASLRLLGTLHGDLKVYPGHELPSTLDRERAYNPYLREALGQ